MPDPHSPIFDSQANPKTIDHEKPEQLWEIKRSLSKVCNLPREQTKVELRLDCPVEGGHVQFFRGESGSDCEEFIRSIYTYVLQHDKADDDKWTASYAASRLGGPALRWFARLDPAIKKDWATLQVALLDQYSPLDDAVDNPAIARLDTQPPSSTVPTPAAAPPSSAPASLGSSSSVPTPAAAPPPAAPAAASSSEPLRSASFTPSVLTITTCKKARIRVQDMQGTFLGWVPENLWRFDNYLATQGNPQVALEVKADNFNTTMGSELRILNVEGWTRLAIRAKKATSGTLPIGQEALLKPVSVHGSPTDLRLWELDNTWIWSSSVWNISDTGAIRLIWGVKGGYPLDAVYGRRQIVFKSIQDWKLQPGESQVKLFYEPIE
ncbi:hypothetical protein FRB90_006195 [Tulasnella sp. 427]|nr:hypothetical protein FRB90_006195 [Tulasnella sp. 427]